MLVATSDLPILSVAAVEISRPLHCARRRRHLRLRGKTRTLRRYPAFRILGRGCATVRFAEPGCAAIKPRALPLLERFIEDLGAARKYPFKLASLFGWDMLARFAIGRLSIAQAEARASRILGAPVRALVSPYPETGVNVDRVSDVELARELVRAG